MSEEAEAETEVGAGNGTEPRGAPDVTALQDEVAELRADLDAVEGDLEERTLPRSKMEAELKRYVRRQTRRGHARGWGPYLVLLYGVVVTLAAFQWLEGPWAILAMVVTFLSTLGLYVLFVLVGVGFRLLGSPRRLAERVREFRGD
jgi:hypothetical protein